MSSHEIDSYNRENPYGKPRIIILSDIGNEPDDQQSLCRLLTYANEFIIEGLIPTTSMWLRNKIRPELMVKVIKAYGGEPRKNLMMHTADYFPSLEELLKLIKPGLPMYGMYGVGENKHSEGSEWIIRMTDKGDTPQRPLWILIWGGANTLAQALWKVKHTRSKKQCKKFIEKLRVFAISDQDDSSLWIRRTFSNLYYIVSPFHDVPDTSKEDYPKYNQFNEKEFDLNRFKLFLEKVRENNKNSTWIGISGDILYDFQGGPNSTLVSDQWLKQNIRDNHGALGKVYPKTKYAMEGDSSSFLYLIPNGLRSTQHPSYGGWGGRYQMHQLKEEPRPIFTDSKDKVMVGNEKGQIRGDIPGVYTSNQATIWRWREAYQHDFAARMDWASTPNYEDVNHPPKVVVKGRLEREVLGNEEIELDASQSSDPDGDDLDFYWFYYREAGTYPGRVSISTPHKEKAILTFEDQKASGFVHIILEVRDSGNPPLYRYARFIFSLNTSS